MFTARQTDLARQISIATDHLDSLLRQQRFETAAAFGPVTKWDILDGASRDRLVTQPCNLHCAGCNQLLVSEADYARHFVIADPRLSNLGRCPTSN